MFISNFILPQPVHQSAEHGRTRRDLARARYKMGGGGVHGVQI